MGGYAFNYLRADGEEKRIGLFSTPKEAEERRSRLASFGAMCSPVFPTEDEPSAKKDNYAEQKIEEFKSFFKTEMAVMKSPGIGYYIIYQFLLTLAYRIRLYVEDNDWSGSKEFAKKITEETGYPPNFYRQEVCRIILKEADLYDPFDGSVPEDIGNKLKELSSELMFPLGKKEVQEKLVVNFSRYNA